MFTNVNLSILSTLTLIFGIKNSEWETLGETELNMLQCNKQNTIKTIWTVSVDFLRFGYDGMAPTCKVLEEFPTKYGKLRNYFWPLMSNHTLCRNHTKGHCQRLRFFMLRNWKWKKNKNMQKKKTLIIILCLLVKILFANKWHS